LVQGVFSGFDSHRSIREADTVPNKFHEEIGGENFPPRRINLRKIDARYLSPRQNPAITEKRTGDRALVGVAEYPKAPTSQCKDSRSQTRAPSEIHFTVVHTGLARAEDGHTRSLPL